MVAPNAPGASPEAAQGLKFLSVWGLAERENPTRPRGARGENGEPSAIWKDGRDPETVRQGLLESPDVLTEVLVGKRTGLGDLVTIDNGEVADDERPALSVDVGLEVASYHNSGQHWETRTFSAPTFGTARDAMQMVGANWARDAEFEPDCSNRDGQDVNVVVVDTGLNEGYLRDLVPTMDFRGGFVTRREKTYGPDQLPPSPPPPLTPDTRPDPGEFSDKMAAQGAGHGNMIARNILRIAPRARIYDAPLLPKRVTSIEQFTSDVEHLYEEILDTRERSEFRDQRWIIVNAWAVANSINETTLGAELHQYYTSGGAHNTNALIQDMSDDFAIIFAAGNNGLFEPSPGAGLYDRGPFRVGEEGARLHGSIAGANALPGVLTVGSCTVHGQWIGSSSMGSAPPAITSMGAGTGNKPDLVAPSWFSETNDRHLTNTGTSAACGLVAGLAAASWSADASRPPQTLLAQMRNAAANNPFENQPAEAALSAVERMGHGIIHYPF